VDGACGVQHAKAATSRRGEAGLIMKYVYMLRSESEPKRFYTGITGDLKDRMHRHNAGEVPHTAKYLPWRLITYVAFSDDARAFQFERYLKTASGRAFAKKRL
jgi:predicted GIY-YIG superfamily endonuclease